MIVLTQYPISARDAGIKPKDRKVLRGWYMSRADKRVWYENCYIRTYFANISY